MDKYFIPISELEFQDRQLQYHAYTKPHMLGKNNIFIIKPEANREYSFMVDEKSETHYAYICRGLSLSDDFYGELKINGPMPL
jgi:hypothetical protein